MKNTRDAITKKFGETIDCTAALINPAGFHPAENSLQKFREAYDLTKNEKFTNYFDAIDKPNTVSVTTQGNTVSSKTNDYYRIITREEPMDISHGHPILGINEMLKVNINVPKKGMKSEAKTTKITVGVKKPSTAKAHSGF